MEVWWSSHRTQLLYFSFRKLWAWDEIRWAFCKPWRPVFTGGWLSLRRCEDGPCFWADSAGASPMASVQLLGEALLGIFSSSLAVTWPYAATPPAAGEVIELSNTLGAPQVGNGSHKLHLLLGDYIAVYKGRTVPIFKYGFPEERKRKPLNIWCSVFFLCLFLCFFLLIKCLKNWSIVDIQASMSFRYTNSDLTILYMKPCSPW